MLDLGMARGVSIRCGEGQWGRTPSLRGGAASTSNPMYTYTYITKASFAGLELPRLLNEVKYSNIRGEQPFWASKSNFRLQVKFGRRARITFFFTSFFSLNFPEFLGLGLGGFGRFFGRFSDGASELKSVHS